MKTDQFFTKEELNEIESLQIRGGNGISPLSNHLCVYTECSYEKCLIQSECTDLNVRCSFTGCSIVKPQDNCITPYAPPACKN